MLKKIGIIGFGDLGQKFYENLMESSIFDIYVCNKNPKKISCIDPSKAHTNINTTLKKTCLIIICFKYKKLNQELVESIKNDYQDKVIISTIAEAEINTIQEIFRTKKVVRSFINKPYHNNKNTIIWTASKQINEEEKSLINVIFGQIGQSIEVQKEENFINIYLQIVSSYNLLSIFAQMLKNSFGSESVCVSDSDILTKQILNSFADHINEYTTSILNNKIVSANIKEKTIESIDKVKQLSQVNQE